ncbi:MAG: glycoside hydrolase 5 family protein [Planctomycetota bacterium]|jgi:hypothetical protein
MDQRGQGSLWRSLGCLFLVLSVLPAQAAGEWEEIDGEYRNLRAFNFIPEYPSLVAYQVGNPDAARSRLPNFRGVASPTVQWCLYSKLPEPLTPGFVGSSSASPKEDVARQLRSVRSVGMNAVRVWLSFPSWKAHRQQFLADFRHFAGLCEANRLYLIPVIWDMFGGTDPNLSNGPGASIPCEDRRLQTGWHTSPGDNWVRLFPAYDPEAEGWTDFATAGEAEPMYLEMAQYIRDVVTVLRDSPAGLLWDAMDEPETASTPGVSDKHVLNFVRQTLKIIKQVDPNAKTTVGMAVLGPMAGVREYAAIPELDVLSVQVYSFTRIRGEAALWGAIESMGVNSKPVICSEVGGIGQFADALNYVSKVPRPDLASPAGQKGMGFVMFQAIVGVNKGLHPYDYLSGLFYSDGKLRNLEDAQALRDFAAGKVSPAVLAGPLVQGVRDPSDPNHSFGWKPSINEELRHPSSGQVLIPEITSSYTFLSEILADGYFDDWALAPDDHPDVQLERLYEYYDWAWTMVLQTNSELRCAAQPPHVPDTRCKVSDLQSYAALYYPENGFGAEVGSDTAQMDGIRIALESHFRGESLIPDFQDRIDLLENMRVLVRPRLTRVGKAVGPY